MSQNSEKRMTVLYSHFFYSFFCFFFLSNRSHMKKSCCIKRCVYIVRKKYEHTSIEKELLVKDRSWKRKRSTRFDKLPLVMLYYKLSKLTCFSSYLTLTTKTHWRYRKKYTYMFMVVDRLQIIYYLSFISYYHILEK